MFRSTYRFFLLLFVLVLTNLLAEQSVAAVSQPGDADSGRCVIAKFSGKATTYSPLCENESWNLSTGGQYSPQGWQAALQLDLAKQHRCGYKGRCYAVVENTANGRAAILLINDNGPLYSGSYGNKGVVIDLNEASMRYLANDPAGARYGNCKGVIPRVNVALLCRLIGQPGPLSEQDRVSWNKIVSAIPNTPLPTNLLSQSSLSSAPPFQGSTNPYSQQMLTPAQTPAPSPLPVSTNYPLPQPIPASSILTASGPASEEEGNKPPQSKVVSDLLNALAGPTTSPGVLSVRAPLQLSESVGPSNAMHLSGKAAISTSNAPDISTLPQSADTFSASYRSADLRWSTPTLFQPFFREVEGMIRSLIDLLKRL